MSAEFSGLTVEELASLYASRKVSPLECVTQLLYQAEELQKQFNPFRVILADRAIESAKDSEKRWLKGESLGSLDGIPVSVKDSAAVQGVSTLMGSQITSKEPATNSSPAVARLEEAGVVVFGKTNLPEFGWKAVTESPLSGVTRNPWNPSKTCGGSSGGAAVVAACGLGPIHMGGDGGGSIRIPASLCGVFGFIASFGRVPRTSQPIFPVVYDGPLTRHVSDAALAMQQIARFDSRDPFPIPFGNEDYLVNLKKGVKGWKIALSTNIGGISIDHDIEKAVCDAAQWLTDLGAEVIEIGSLIDDPSKVWRVIKLAMQASKINGRTGEQLAKMDPDLVKVARQGLDLTCSDFHFAHEGRMTLGVKFAELFTRYRLLITPSLPITAFEIGYNNPPNHPKYGQHTRSYSRFNGFLYPFNILPNPAASVPIGFDRNRLPIGLQMVGKSYCDADVLRAASALEEYRPWTFPTPV